MTHDTNLTDNGEAADAFAMEEAYARGDHLTARRLSRALAWSSEPSVKRRAEAVRAATEPDRMIEVLALVGLGVVGWLVYNYVL